MTSAFYFSSVLTEHYPSIGAPARALTVFHMPPQAGAPLSTGNKILI
ncbi:MAG: hypothetical protein K2Y32_20620 [Candidatus Obscuribacterales bacterium]|nr:hypothetical protein [Candidatus Obscuribacterales bacterium]